jgi:3-deoxy-D-arabino-heptulosonate 7-phosphate (DAHP) synthase
MAGVDRVVPISRPYKLASSELFHQGPTAFELAGRRVGGGDTFCLIAGPCTVKTREPSASGDRRLVELLSRAAAAVGADGIIVEVHDHPEAALCDGPQSLGTGSFADYVAGVAGHARLVGKELA